MSIKPVLILECTNERLGLNEAASQDSFKKTGRKDYIMEGVFTQFMIRNRNERVYTPGKFLPHLNELLGRKKELGVVYGEFDHPDVFDTSLSRVSHTIESANYLQKENRVDGAVRLTNTYWGKEAKALVDDNLPIFISSRAAGVTESNGEVEVKKLFTYDIVADPGFSSAKLNMKVMNESCGFKVNNPLVRIYDLSESTKTNELFVENKNDQKTQAQMLEYLNYLQGEVAQVKKSLNGKIQESKITETSVVEIEKLAEYQESLHETMAHIIKYLDYISENVSISLNESAALNKKTDVIIEHNDYLSSELENAINFGDYISEKLNQTINHNDHIAVKLNESIQFGNYIVEHLNNNINYAEYVTEHLNKSIRFGNYLSGELDATIGYTELLAEKLSNSIEYGDYIREELNMNINYTEKIGKSVNKVINYANYISETLDTTIAFTELLGENLNNTMEYADYVVECADNAMVFADNIGKSISNKSGLLKESISIQSAKDFLKESEGKDKELINTTSAKKTAEEEAENCDLDDETKTIIKESLTFTSDLKSDVLRIIAEAKKTEASKEEEPHFYSFLTKEDIKTFESFSKEDQSLVKLAVNESSGYYSRADVLAIMHNSTSAPVATATDVLLNAMPETIRPIWESLEQQDKIRMIAESTNYVLENDEERAHFWTTRKVQAKNEYKKHIAHTDLIQNESLSDEDVQNFMSKFKMLG